MGIYFYKISVKNLVKVAKIILLVLKFIDKLCENDIIIYNFVYIKGMFMKKINNREIVESFSMVLQFGINMLVPIVMCIALGVWLGDKYNMDWIVIPLFFVGVLAGYNSIFRMVQKYLKGNKSTETKKEQDVKKN